MNNEELLPTFLHVILTRGKLALVPKLKGKKHESELYNKALETVYKAELDSSLLKDAAVLSIAAWKEIYKLYYD